MRKTTTAVAFMLGASALVAATSIIAKVLGAEPAGLHPLQVTAGRFVFALATLLVVLIVAPAKRPSLKTRHFPLHVARVVCGVTGVTLTFAAVQAMPVAEATALSFLSPLVAMGLAVVMLSERIGPRKIFATLLALVGGLLVLRPGTEAFEPAGLLALGAALAMGLETVLIKRLTNTEPAFRILLINNAIGAGLSCALAAFVWRMPMGGEWPLLVAVGVVMVSAQFCFLNAMQRGEASFVMPVFYSVLAFAALYDAALFGVVPVPLSIVGSLFIVGAALLLAAQGRGEAAAVPAPEEAPTASPSELPKRPPRAAQKRP